MKLFLTESLQ